MHKYGHFGPRQAAQTRAHSRLILHSVPGGIFPPSSACTSDAKPNRQYIYIFFYRLILYVYIYIKKINKKKKKEEEEEEEKRGARERERQRYQKE